MATNPTTTNTDFSSKLATIDPAQAGALTQLLQLVKDYQLQDQNDPRVQIVRGKAQSAKPYHERRLKAIASITPINATHKDTMAVSQEQATRLEQIRELVNDVDQLTGVIDQLENLQNKLLKQQAVIIEEPVLSAIWQGAIDKINDLLNRPMQLSSDSQPTTVIQATASLKKLVTTFNENPTGPGGDRLWENPARLENFTNKLEDIEPQPLILIRNAQELLDDQQLSPQHLEQVVKQKQTELTKFKVSQGKVKEIVSRIENKTKKAVAEFNQELADFIKALGELSAAPDSSSELKTKLQSGLKLINDQLVNQLGVDQIETILSWIGKYQNDPHFTTKEMEDRVKRDIEEPLANFKKQLLDFKEEYDPIKLKQVEEEQRQQTIEQFKKEVEQLSTQVVSIYDQLIQLRKSKLGVNPDERFFGEVAKSVNDLITALGQLQNQILELKGSLSTLTTIAPDQTNRLAQLKIDAQKLFDQSANFTNPEALEKLLGQQIVAIIKPLEEKVQQAKDNISSLNNLVAEFKGQLGFDGQLEGELTQLVTDLQTGLNKATHFISQAKADSKKITDVEQQLGNHHQTLDQTMRKVRELASKEKIQQKIEDNLKLMLQKQQQELGQRQQKSEELKMGFAQRISYIINQAVKLGQRLKAAAGYARDLEKYDSSRSLEYFELLKQILNGLTVESLGGLSHSQFFLLSASNQKSAEEILNKSFVTSNEPESVFIADAQLTDLESEVNDSSLLSKTIVYLESYNQQHSLGSYQEQQKQQLQKQLEAIIRDKADSLGRINNELEADSKLKINLTVDDARKWLSTFDSKRQSYETQMTALNQLKEALTKLTNVGSDQLKLSSQELEKILQPLGESLPRETVDEVVSKRLEVVSHQVENLINVQSVSERTANDTNQAEAPNSGLVQAKTQMITINANSRKTDQQTGQ